MKTLKWPSAETVADLDGRYEAMWANPANAERLVSFAWVPPQTVDRSRVLDDPARMLDMCLGVLERNLSVPNDFLPMVRAEFGTVLGATAFGADVMVRADGAPAVQTHPIQNGEDLEKAGTPGPRTAGLFPRALEHMAYFREQLPEAVRVCQCDSQGPWNTAQLLGGNEIFLNIYDDPGFVSALVGRVADFLISAVPEMKRAVREKEDWFYLQGMKFKGGGRICNCSTDMVSADFYEEVVLPHDRRFLDAVGGGMIHICGNNTHCIRHFNTIPNLYALEIAFNAMDFFEVSEMVREDMTLVCTGPVEPPLLTPLGRATLERFCRGELPAKRNVLFHFNDPADADRCRRLYEGIRSA